MNIKETIAFLSQFPEDMEISFGYYAGEAGLAREDFTVIEENGIQSLVISDYEWSADGRDIRDDPRLMAIKSRFTKDV